MDFYDYEIPEEYKDIPWFNFSLTNSNLSNCSQILAEIVQTVVAQFPIWKKEAPATPEGASDHINFARSIENRRNIWYNINNLKDFAAVTICALATVWQQKIR